MLPLTGRAERRRDLGGTASNIVPIGMFGRHHRSRRQRPVTPDEHPEVEGIAAARRRVQPSVGIGEQLFGSALRRP